MAIINCPECNKGVSNTANSCPHCGYLLNKLKNISKKKTESNGCLIFIIVMLIMASIFYIIGSNDSNSNPTIKSSYQGPPMFVLTELNGKELEENAYFTIKYDNTFELKTGDGTIFKYTPTQHVGSDPLCNIVATDNRGRNTAICIKKMSGMNVVIMLENDEMISNFKGYKR